MITRVIKCSMCHSGHEDVVCSGIYVASDNMTGNHRTIWLCDDCFDRFPTDLCIVKRNLSIPNRDSEIFLDRTKFPNFDTYAVFLECVIGSGSLRSQRGDKIKRYMDGITSRFHAVRQMRILLTEDWVHTIIGLSNSVLTAVGAPTIRERLLSNVSQVDFTKVDFGFLADLYWWGNKWGYAPNQVRVVFMQYEGKDTYYVIVSTDDVQTQEIMRVNLRDPRINVVFDERFTFDNVDEAVRNLAIICGYINSDDEHPERWVYFEQYVSSRHFDTFYENLSKARMLYQNERGIR